MGRRSARRRDDLVDRGERVAVRSMPVNRDLVAFMRPACDMAVDRAVHDTHPDRFHDRFPPGLDCPLCPDFKERVRTQIMSSLNIDEMRATLATTLEHT